MLVDLYIERLRHGSVAHARSGEIVSRAQAAPSCSMPATLSAISPATKRSRSRFRGQSAPLVPGLSRSATGFTSAPPAAMRIAAAGRLHRHRHVQHAALDAGARRRRARGRQQSARHRGAVRWSHSDRARHGDQRGRHGQDPHGGEGGKPIPATWAVRNDGSPTTNPSEAIAGMLLPAARPERLRPGIDDRSDVRAFIGRRQRAIKSAALRRSDRPLRLLSSCSSPSMSAISAIYHTSAPKLRRGPSKSGLASARRTSAGFICLANRNGGGAKARAAKLALSAPSPTP